MKKVMYALTIATVVFLSSCGDKMSSPVIGKWKLVDIGLPKVDISSEMNTNIDSAGVTGVDTAMKEMTKGMETMANAMTDVGSAMANAFLKGSTYEFKDNGKVEVSILFGTQNGTFTISPDNKDLKVTLDGKEQAYTVTSATEKALVLTTPAGETWTFEAK
ncbi:MAG: hypothetical protein K0S33_1819 [Bacteroidetes bacterium]|jgi:hypothetical protein|nr:hypothetical protein [Bacteroidota bacterium]